MSAPMNESRQRFRSRKGQSIGRRVHQWTSSAQPHPPQDRGDGSRWRPSLCHQPAVARVTRMCLQDPQSLSGIRLGVCLSLASHLLYLPVNETGDGEHQTRSDRGIEAEDRVPRRGQEDGRLPLRELGYAFSCKVRDRLINVPVTDPQHLLSRPSVACSGSRVAVATTA